MQNGRVGAYLNGNAVEVFYAVGVLYVFFVDEVVLVRGVHHDDDAVLDTLLADGEHDGHKLTLARPLLGLVAHEGGDAVDGLELCRLVSAAGLDASEHYLRASLAVHHVLLGGVEVFGHIVGLDLFKKLWDDG